MKTVTTDVLIIGAGPAGSTFARWLIPEGLKILLLDAGPQYSPTPGVNLKNSFPFQRNMGNFSHMIQGFLHPLSVPTEGGASAFVDPITMRQSSAFIRAGMNPRQNPTKNLDSASAAYSVGGMLLHWTGAVPRHHPVVERSNIISAQDWDDLYSKAEILLNKHTDVYSHSIRNILVKEALSSHYSGSLPKDYPVQDLPMAAERNKKNSELVRFTGTDTILNVVLQEPKYAERLTILPQHRVRRLIYSSGKVCSAEVDDLQTGERYHISAKYFIVACGTVLSAQLLWASGIRPTALGRYIFDHPIAFCQVILSKKIVDQMETDPRFADARKRKHPLDPLPLPMDDPSPNIWIPVSEGRPWHCQITKDAFHYGALPVNLDDRLIVDLRWFSSIDTRETNRVTFEDDISNEFGMPQPTFDFSFSNADAERMHAMMQDMLNASQALGGFLPGSEPRFMPWGLCLHLQGSCRIGSNDDGTSVVDQNCKVWGFENLFIGGNSVIPTSNACNPTLTNVALATRAALHIGSTVFSPP